MKKKAVTWGVVLFLMVFAESAMAGSVQGRLINKFYMPVHDVVLLFFKSETGPPPTTAWRHPDVTRRAGANGWFKVELPQGHYYMGAIKSNNSEHPDRTKLLVLDGQNLLKKYGVANQGLLDLGSVVMGDI